MRLWLLCAAWLVVPAVHHGQPTQFFSRGIGGGGALFSPAIHPGQPDEVYIASDLGGLYHTHNGGLQYDVVHFTEAQTNGFSKVCHTGVPGLKYALLYNAEYFVLQPARSTDNGVTWDFLAGDLFPFEDKWFVYADYEMPDRVIWTDYSRIYFSADGGQTAVPVWTALDNGAGILLSGVYWQGDQIYLGTNDGILLSDDGGQSFQLANYSGIPDGEVIIGFGGGSDGQLTRFFVLTGDENSVWVSNLGFNYWALIRGVYRMENQSGIWTPAMNGIDISEDFVCYLGMARNDPHTCWLAGSDNTERANVIRTSDGGASWEKVFHYTNNANIYTGYSGHQGDLSWYWGGNALGFTVNALNSNDALFTDYGFIHRTKDGGDTWHQAYLDPADENPPGMPTPQKKYYGGVGMEQTTVWHMEWFDKDHLFGCFTDIRGVRSKDGGHTWSFDYQGHSHNTMYRIARHPVANLWFGATSSIHDIYQTTYVTDNRLFPSFRDGHVLWSDDLGSTWQVMRDFDHPVIWVATNLYHPDQLYVSVLAPDDAVGGLWRADGISQPATATWTKLPNPPANMGRIFNVHALDDGTLVTTWSARKHNTASVFSDSSGVFVSTDGGMTWDNRSRPEMRFWTKDLVLDPADPTQSTWYVGVWSGWGGPANDLGRLWRTVDRGINWQPITGPQQFHRVSSVTFDPVDPETMYLTTEAEGLWVTHDKSASQPSWTLVESYPFGHPERVFFNPYDPQEMWVASFGNGMRVGRTGTVSTAPEKPVSQLLQVWPQPGEGTVQVRFEATGPVHHTLFDVTGRQIFTTRREGGNDIVMLPAIPAGWYLWEARTMEGKRKAAPFVWKPSIR